MIKFIESKLNEDDYENYNYKNKIVELISYLTKASIILQDDGLIEFINEETDNWWYTPRDIDDYIEALRNLIN